MRDIAKASGLSLAGLYHHFSGKDELLYRIEEDAYHRLLAPLRKFPSGMTSAQKIERIIHNHVVFFAGQITEMKVLSHELAALGGDRGRRLRRMQREYFTLCLRAVSGLLRGRGHGVRDARAATMCLFGMINWIYTWYRPERDGDPDALARFMTGVLLHGLVPTTGPVDLAGLRRRKQRKTSKVR
jgi:TetR/AcrR family transcriptional regulator